VLYDICEEKNNSKKKICKEKIGDREHNSPMLPAVAVYRADVFCLHSRLRHFFSHRSGVAVTANG